MNSFLKIFLTITLLSLLFSACNQWSEKDSDLFLEQCEKTKWKKEFCDCSLEKIKTTFNSFEEINSNEEIMASYLMECIDHDRIEEDSISSNKNK